MRVVLPNDFEPRPYQARAMRYFDGGGKRAITPWHRRAGKDLTAIHQTAKHAHQEVGMYWHFYPTFEQARRSIWEGFRRDGKRIMENCFPGFLDPKSANSIVKRKNDQQMMLELKCGSIWRLMGSDRSESVGAGPKGIVYSEFSLCRPTAWSFVRPMLRESRGWAWFIFTPRGHNHAYELYEKASQESGWFRDLQTVRMTGLQYQSNRNPDRLIDAEEMMAEERAEGMHEELIRQEYLCDFNAALVGSVWGDLLERLQEAGGIGEFEHDVDDVFVCFDIGISDDTSMWAWRVNGAGSEFVEHYSSHGKPMSHYFDKLDEWRQTRGLRYAKLVLPHDARARTLQTGESIYEQTVHQASAGRWGNAHVVIGPKLSLLDGIQAGRWLLQQPGTRFHARCGPGIESLRQYHYEYDEGRKTFSAKPVHDWSSHDADAFRYSAVVVRTAELLTRKPEKVAQGPLAVPLDGSFTLEQLHSFAAADRGSRGPGRI